MFTCNRILFPVDFSERCERAIPLVQSMAARFGAEVTLLHVAESPLESPGAKGMVDLELFGAGRWDTAKLVRVVETGDPAAKILAAAEAFRPGLIMLPTHGYGVFRRWLLGSVTAKLLHDLRIPVWTDAHLEETPAPRNLDIRRIVCALNLEDSSVPLLRWAAAFAGAWTAELRIVHAIPAAEHLAGQPDEPFSRFLLDTGRRMLAGIQQQAGAHAQAIVTGGEISGTVARLSEEWKADLIIAGRGQLRSHAYAIIRDSPCPVITV